MPWRNLLPLLPFALCANLAAFELPSMRAGQVPAASQANTPAPRQENFTVYTVNGVELAVPRIGAGRDLLAVLKPGLDSETLSAPLRRAFGAGSGTKAVPLLPRSAAELSLAAGNPGAAILSLNQFLPPGAAELFNRDAGFAGPNCFNAAFTAAGLTRADKLRHVGVPEAEQLLAMYFKPVPAADLRPGDVLVFNSGDHAAYYLGGGLIFHKKSYLKQYIYRIAPLEEAYEPEPYEWSPGPFDNAPQFGTAAIRSTAAWRRTTAQYQPGPVSGQEPAKIETITFITEQIETQAPRWALARELGYFTERLLEDLVSDWSAMAGSADPARRACYHRLESLRDQANQSVELELLSSPYSQANAVEILKSVWLPRNAYSRELALKLLKVYGRSPAAAEQVLEAIAADYDGRPLLHIKQAPR